MFDLQTEEEKPIVRATGGTEPNANDNDVDSNPIPGAPDLTVETSNQVYSLRIDEILPLSIGIRNIGTAATTQPTLFGVFLLTVGADGQLTGEQFSLGTSSIPAGLGTMEQLDVSVTVDLRRLNGLTPGSNYIIAVKVQNEEEPDDVTNNNLCAIGILAAQAGLPELEVVADTTASYISGTKDNLTVSFRVNNWGRAASGEPMICEVYLTKDGIVDGEAILLQRVQTSVPDSLSYVQYSTTIALAQLSGISAGDYKIVVRVANADESADTLANNQAVVGALSLIRPVNEFVVTSLADSGEGTLRDAVTLANACAEDEDVIIRFADDLDGMILLTNDIYVERKMTLNGNAAVSIRNGAIIAVSSELTLNNMYVCDSIELREGATLEGAGNYLTEVILNDFGGLISDVLRLQTDSSFSLKIGSLSGDAVLDQLPGSCMLYCDVQSGQTLMVEESVTLKGRVRIKAGGTLKLNGTRIEGALFLSPGATLEGEGNVFVGEYPIALWEWSGAASNVLSMLDSLENTTFESENLQIGIDSLSGDAVLDVLPEGFSSYYSSYLSVADGKTLAVREGVTLTGNTYVESTGTLKLNGARIEGSLFLSPEATLEGEGNVFTDECPIYLFEWNGAASNVLSMLDSLENTTFESENLQIGIDFLSGDAVLDVLPEGFSSYTSRRLTVRDGETLTVREGVTLTGNPHVESGGTINMGGAIFGGTLSIETGANVKISNCDLSETTLSIYGYNWNNGEYSVIDLSGNWWGTTDEAEIRAKIEGYYDPAYTHVIIDGWLTEAPNTKFEVEDPVDSKLLSAADHSLTVRFSHAVDASSITEESVYLENAHGERIPILSTSVKGKTLTLTFDALPTDGDYRLVIGPEVMGTNGVTLQKWLGEISQEDCRIPIYADVTAEHVTALLWEAVDHPSYLDVCLSGAIDPSTVSANGIILLDPQGAAVSLLHVEMKGETVIRLHVGTLTEPGDYELHLPDTITDGAGNALVEDSRIGSVLLASSSLSIAEVSASYDGQIKSYVIFPVSITNSGNVAEEEVKVKVWLQDAAGLRTLLGTVTAEALAAGETRMLECSLPVAESLNLEETNYTLVAEVSGRHELPALRMNNESTVGTLNVTYPPAADLRITAMSMPTALCAGQSVDFQISITNEGTASAQGQMKMNIYLIPVGGTLSQGVLLGTYSIDTLHSSLSTGNVSDDPGSISPGVTLSCALEGVQIPADIALAGDVQVVAIINPDGEIDEKPADRADNVYVAPEALALSAALTLSVSATEVKEGDSRRVVYTITRSGSNKNALTVQLNCEQAKLLGLPQSLTIAAGQSYTCYQAAIVDNKVYQGDQDVEINVSAAGYVSSSAQLRVLDDELPPLTLTLPQDKLTEGERMTAVLTLAAPAKEDTVVKLGSSLSGQISMPSSVTIKAGETGASFEIIAINDKTAEIDKTLTITAKANGTTAASEKLTIVDDDIPSVQLVLNRTLVSEGDGYAVITATLTRTGNMSEAVTVRLSDTNNIGLILPSSIRIAANVKAVNFNIGVVDDTIVNGERTGVITGTLILESCGCSTSTSTNGGEIVSVPVTITDNDGPTLSVKLSRTTLREGGSEQATITVTTNYVTDQDLVVHLSENTGYLDLPESITIAAGQSSASAGITAKTDSQTSGNHLTTITAAAEGFTAGIGFIQVTDIDLPDLVVRGVTIDGEAIAGRTLSVAVEVFNQGYAATSKPIAVSLTLSNGDSLGIIHIPGSLAAGESAIVTTDVTLPAVTGDRHITACVNSNSTISELDTLNNTATSTNFNIAAGYSVVANVDKETVYDGSPVTITGTLVPDAEGLPVAGQSLVIMVRTARGLLSRVSVVTDENGNFSTTCTPIAGVVGTYAVSASVLGSETEILTGFENAGVSVDVKNYLRWDVEIGNPISGVFTITNTGNVSLTNLHVVSANLPSNISLELDGMDDELEAKESLTVHYTVSGVDLTQGTEYQKFDLNIRSDEGFVQSVNAYAYVTNLLGDISLNVNNIRENIYFDSTSGTGSVRYVNFTITNTGDGETGTISINLPSVDWLYLYSSSTIESLARGESSTVILAVDPSRVDDLITNYAYRGNLVVSSENGGSEQMGFSFTFVEEKTASLRVELHDSYTQYADSKSVVSTARARLVDAYTPSVVYSSHADEGGLCSFSNVVAGTYYLYVDADGCAQSKTLIHLKAGADVEEAVMLSNQSVVYVWNVEKKEYEEQYTLTQTVDFVTQVPSADVRCSGEIIIPEMAWGESTIVPYTVSNYGLIAAKEFSLSLPDWDNFTFNVLNPTESIAANSSYTFYIEITWGDSDASSIVNGEVVRTDFYGNEYTSRYDANGRLVGVTDSSGGETSYGYDDSGRNTWVCDANNNYTWFEYESSGRIAAVTDQNGVRTSYTYTEDGWLESIKEANGNTIRYEYNESGNCTNVIYADGTKETVGYDANGNIISVTSRNGDTTEITYNAQGMVSSKLLGDDSLISYSYDSSDMLHSVSWGDGETITYDYDSNYRLTKVTYSSGETLMYEYYDNGCMKSMVDENGKKTCYAYNENEWLSRVTDDHDNLLQAYTYDPNGRILSQVSGNGTYTLFSYAKNGKVASKTNYSADGSVYSFYRYTYDAMGLCRSMETAEGTWTYEYDAVGQLVHALFTPVEGSTAEVQDLSYEYDSSGNRVHTQRNGVEQIYLNNELNQTVAVGEVRMEYDANGNLIRSLDANGETVYTYNALGKLARMETPDAVYEYEYNALGQRVSVSENGVVTQYFYDPFGNLLNEYNAEGQLLHSYLHGNGVFGYSDLQHEQFYYQGDMLGSVTGITDGSGNLICTQNYTPDGDAFAVSGSADFNHLFRWLGQYGLQTDASGLVYMNSRYYDPVTGSFTQPDPSGVNGGINLYAYCGNDPISYLDVTGLGRVVSEAMHFPSLYTLGALGALTGVGNVGLYLSVGSELLGATTVLLFSPDNALKHTTWMPYHLLYLSTNPQDGERYVFEYNSHGAHRLILGSSLRPELDPIHNFGKEDSIQFQYVDQAYCYMLSSGEWRPNANIFDNIVPITSSTGYSLLRHNCQNFVDALVKNALYFQSNPSEGAKWICSFDPTTDSCECPDGTKWTCLTGTIKQSWIECDENGNYKWNTSVIKTAGDCEIINNSAIPDGYFGQGWVGIGGGVPSRGEFIPPIKDPTNPRVVSQAKGECTPCKAGILNSIYRCLGLDNVGWFDVLSTGISFVFSPINTAKKVLTNVMGNIFSIKCARNVLNTLYTCEVIPSKLKSAINELLDVIELALEFKNLIKEVKDLAKIGKQSVTKTANNLIKKYLSDLGIEDADIKFGKGPLSYMLCMKATVNKIGSILKKIKDIYALTKGDSASSGSAASLFLLNTTELCVEDIRATLTACMTMPEICGPFDVSFLMLDGSVSMEDYLEWNTMLSGYITGEDDRPRTLTDAQIASLQNTNFSKLCGAEALLDLYYNAWNRTVRYNELGIFSAEDVESLNKGDLSMIPADLLDPDTGLLSDWFFTTEYCDNIRESYEQACHDMTEAGYDNMQQYVTAASDALKNYVTSDESGVCATVTLQFSQSVTMSREAFEGTFTLNNGSNGGLSDISLTVYVCDKDGVDVTDKFEVYYYYVSDEFGSYSGGNATPVSGASLAASTSGTMNIRFTPDKTVAEAGSENYDFRATLDYTDADGTSVTINLTPVTLQVNPSPSLTLHYFLQEDIYSDDPFTSSVEAPQIAELGVLVHNTGKGIAKNYKMSNFTVDYLSNDMGLALDFNLEGVSLNGGARQALGTEVAFGNIVGNDAASAIWYFTTNVQGHFANYENSTITRTDSLGNVSVVNPGDPFSIIDSVETHLLVRSMDADGDGRTDFLANDDGDPRSLADTLYLGDGSVENVFAVNTASVSGSLGAGVYTVTLTAYLHEGYNYIRLDDEPAHGQYVIMSVSTGFSDLAEGTFWQTNRVYSADGAASYVDRLHILYNSPVTGNVTFTLTYDSVDHSAPMVTDLSGVSDRTTVNKVPEVVVSFSEAIDQSTFTAECIELQKNGVKVDPSTITWEWTSDRTLRLTNLNLLAAGDSLYTLTVTNKGLQDVFGNAGIGDGKRLQWTMAAEALSVHTMKILGTRQGKDPVTSVQISFTREINDFNTSHLYVKYLRNGVSTYVEDLSGLSIRQVDESGCIYEVTGLDSLQGTDGDYLIGVNTENLYSTAGTQAVETVADLSWTLCRTAPTVLDTKSDVSENTHDQAKKILFSFDRDIAEVDTAGLHLLCNGVETTAYTLAAKVDEQDASKVIVTLLDASGQEQRRGLRGADSDEAVLQGQWSLQMDLGGVTDIYGNVGEGTSTTTWKLDSMAPAEVQSITLSGKETTVVSVVAPTLGMTLPEKNLKVTVYGASMSDSGLGKRLWSGTVEGTDFSQAISLPFEGRQKLNIVLEDAAGNATTCTFEVMLDVVAISLSIKAEEQYKETPESIALVFTAPVRELPMEALTLTFNGQVVDTAELTLTQVSATEWVLGGLKSAVTENGAYTVSVDLSQLTKASSGLSGKGIVGTSFVVDSITSVEITDSSLEVTPGSVESLSVRFNTAINYAELSTAGLLPQAVHLVNQETGEVVLLDAGGFAYADDKITWNGCTAVPAGQYSIVVDASLVTAVNCAPLTLGGSAETAVSGFGTSASLLGILGASYTAPYAVDWNGDGLVDLLVGEKTGGTGKIRVYLNKGTATVPMYTDYTYLQTDGEDVNVAASGCQGIVVTQQDLNGDGTPDLVVGLADGSVLYYIGGEGHSFGTSQTLSLVDGTAIVARGARAYPTFFDWNRDGVADLVLGTGDGSLMWAAGSLAQDGSLSFGALTYTGIETVSRTAPAFADVNGDGLDDLLVGDGEGNLALYYGSSDGFTLVQVWALDGVSWTRTRPTFADLNGDGKLDIVVGGSTGSVYVLHGQENAWSSTPVTVEALPVLSGVQAMAEGRILTVTWELSSVPGVGYKVQVSSKGDFSDAEEYTGDTSGTLILPNTPDGSYVVRVQVIMPNGTTGDWAVSAPVVVDTTAPASPLDLVATVEGSNVVFSWGAVDDPSGVHYEIRYSQMSDFSTSHVRELAEGSLTVSDLEDGKWYWQVRAVDGKGNESVWVSGRELMVDTSLLSHWVLGLTPNEQGGMPLGGYFDVNKSGTAADSNLCWAAAAANMLAWWQQEYDAANLTHISVDMQAGDIYATMRRNWKNVSGSELNGLIWWLDGAESTDENYLSYWKSNFVGTGADGSYYFAYFNGDTLAEQVAEVSLKGCGSASIAAAWSSTIDEGGILSVGLYRNLSVTGNLSGGHAVTLWGFDCRHADDTLTRIYVTDSDDGQETLVSLDVTYDSASGYYKVQDGDSRLDGCYLGNYTYLSAPGQDLFKTVLAAPKGLSVADTNNLFVIFNWDAVQEAAMYKLQFSMTGDYTDALERSVGAQTTYELNLTRGDVPEGSYVWRMQAVSSDGVLSAWSEGGAYTVDLSVAALTGLKVTTSHDELFGLGVTLNWDAVEDPSGIVRYEIRYATSTSDFGSIDQVKSTEFTFFLTDEDIGNYYYQVRAMDGRGNTNEWTGGVLIRSCSAVVGERGAALDWFDVDGADSYVVQYSTNADFSGAKRVVLNESEHTLTNLTAGADYYWRVAARDMSGKSLGLWSEAQHFTTSVSVDNDVAATTQSELKLVQQGSTISAMVSEYVGPDDPQDYFLVRVNTTATYDLSLDADQLNEPIYLSIGTVVNSEYNAISTMMISGSSKRTGLMDLLLEGGRDYYVRVSTLNAGASGYNGHYVLTMQAEVVPDAHITDNNSFDKADRLILQDDDTAGLSGWVGAADEADIYRIDLTEAGILSFRLDDLSTQAKMTVFAENNGEQSSIFTRTVRKTGLDKELSVSAGTYYVQVNTVAQGNSLYNTAYSLDIEVELESGARKQGVLAAI